MGMLSYWEAAHGLSSSNDTFIQSDCPGRSLEEGLWFHFTCVSTGREGEWGRCMHECIEKELERTEAVGRFECLIKVLANDSKHCALGILEFNPVLLPLTS